MIRKYKIINRKKIGDIEFIAIAYVDAHSLLELAINFHNCSEPLLCYQILNDKNIIHVEINTSVFYHIQNLKSFDTELRKIHYRQFNDFLVTSTAAAQGLVQNNSEYQYTYDMELKECLKQAYLYN